MTAALIAAAFTFTASATGVVKGTPIEFLFTGRDSDRDYEAMFAIDMPIDEFARALEKAGLQPGKPIDPRRCQVWPVGTRIALQPDWRQFVSVSTNNGIAAPEMIYTGGSRAADGRPVAATETPASVFSFYSLAQSLFVPDGIYEQGEVYGNFLGNRYSGNSYQLIANNYHTFCCNCAIIIPSTYCCNCCSSGIICYQLIFFAININYR